MEETEEKRPAYQFFPSKNGESGAGKPPKHQPNATFTVKKAAGVKRFKQPNISRGNLNTTVKRVMKRKGQVNNSLLRTSLSQNNRALANALAQAKAENKLLSRSVLSLQREISDLRAANTTRKETRKDALQGMASSVQVTTDLMRQLLDSVGVSSDWVTKLDSLEQENDEDGWEGSAPEEARPFIDSRPSDIFAAPECSTSKSIYNSRTSLNLVKAVEPPKIVLTSAEATGSSSSTDVAENPRPVRSKTRAQTKAPVDLSVLMESSVIMDEAPPVQFESSNAALDTVNESDDLGSDLQTSTNRRTFTKPLRPRRTSSLLGRAEGKSLLSPEIKVPAKISQKAQSGTASTTTAKKTAGRDKEANKIPTSSLLVHTPMKLDSGHSSSGHSFNAASDVTYVERTGESPPIRPMSPDVYQMAYVEGASPEKYSSTSAHTPMKLDGGHSSAASFNYDVPYVERTGESPPIRPMTPEVYQMAYVEGASPEKYCAKDSSSTSSNVAMGESEEQTPQHPNILSPSKTVVRVNRRGTFVVTQSSAETPKSPEARRGESQANANDESEDDDEVVRKPTRKRNHVILESDDEEEEVELPRVSPKKKAVREKSPVESRGPSPVNTPSPMKKPLKAAGQSVSSMQLRGVKVSLTRLEDTSSAAQKVLPSRIPQKTKSKKVEEAVIDLVGGAESDHSDSDVSDKSSRAASASWRREANPLLSTKKKPLAKPKVSEADKGSTKRTGAKGGKAGCGKTRIALMPLDRDPYDMTFTETEPVEKFTRPNSAANRPSSHVSDVSVEEVVPLRKERQTEIDLDQVFSSLGMDSASSKKTEKAAKPPVSRKQSDTSSGSAAWSRGSKKRGQKVAEPDPPSDNESVQSVRTSRPGSSRAELRDSGAEEESGRGRRRAATGVSYKEPKLNVKMRQK